MLRTGVAVEKLDLSENRPKRSDQKCIGDRRKSFIGHPDATHFRRKFCERVFQQLRLFTTSLTRSAVSRYLGLFFHDFERTFHVSAQALVPFERVTMLRG